MVEPRKAIAEPPGGGRAGFAAGERDATERPARHRDVVTERPVRQRDVVTEPWRAPQADAPIVDRFPEWLGRVFRRERKLGKGGMGVVYRYRDTKLGRLVAVKSLPARYASDPEWRTRLEREGRTLATLDHPNIARILHVEEFGGTDFLILEYVPGRNLAEHLDRSALPVSRALELCLQIGRAIEAGHHGNIIHGDLKPANVMITPDDCAKVLDYGLARDLSRADDDAIVGGTRGYMAPEQIARLPIDERADVWSFGCVLFECLTGAPAFMQSPSERRVTPVMRLEPNWSALPEATPPAVRDVLEHCLRPDRHRRMRDLGDACAAIEGALAVPERNARGRPVSHNVPTRVSRFIRRDGEVDRVHDLVRSTRLLTIIGPGGAGKTRLALEIARDALEADVWNGVPPYPDGIWVVELKSLADPAHLAMTVATVLGEAGGPAGKPEQPTLDALIAAIGARRMLVIMDNCEHLRDACRDLAEQLLRRCPHLQLLATSREALGTGGEQLYPVPALTCPPIEGGEDMAGYEAVRLFEVRAAQARPGFRVAEHNRDDVAEICRRLRGMPLAIELAAARVRAMSVGEIASHLFEVLDPARVLESSIEWSMRLLSGPERRMLARLSVFRGGWSLEAAEAVCSDERTHAIDGEAVVQLLAQLVEKSLVIYDVERARYHLLETVREYAERRLLRPHAAGAVRMRHLEYVLQLTQEAYGGRTSDRHAAWIDRLEVEHDNLRAALRFSQDSAVDPAYGGQLAVAAHVFWYVRGHLAEGEAWLDAALRRRAGSCDLLQMQGLNAAGILAARRGDLDAADRSYRAALGIAHAVDDRVRAAGILGNLGLLAQESGRPRESRAFLEEAFDIFRDLGDADGVARIELNLSTLAKLEHRDDEARALLDACLPVFRRGGDKQRIAAALQNLGEIECRSGRPDCAAASLGEGLSLSAELGDRAGIASAVLWFGAIAEAGGLYERAACLYGAAASVRDHSDAPMPSVETVDYERTVTALRSRLPGEVFTRRWSEGNALSAEQAAAYALEEAS